MKPRFRSKIKEIAILAIIGGIASIADAIVLWCVNLLSPPIWVSGTIGYIIGTLVVYFLSNKFVFTEGSSRKKLGLELSLFFAVGFIGLILNDLILTYCVESLGIAVLTSKLISVFLVFAWNTAGRYTAIWIVRSKI